MRQYKTTTHELHEEFEQDDGWKLVSIARLPGTDSYKEWDGNYVDGQPERIIAVWVKRKSKEVLSDLEQNDRRKKNTLF